MTRSARSKESRSGRSNHSTADDLAAVVLINSFIIRHLIWLYGEFEGDLVQAIVLGEVAHHGVFGLRNQAGTVRELSRAIAERISTSALTRMPTNAFSIAAATGIPRQTVRRKLEALRAKGWVTSDDAGNLVVSDAVRRHFAARTAALPRDVLALAAEVAALYRD